MHSISAVLNPPSPPARDHAWKKLVERYRQPSTPKAWGQILNTMVSYAAVWALMYFAVGYSWWLVIPLMVLGGGLLIRVFIIFHDCGHGSFFRSKAANDTTGFIAGLLTFTPYLHWRSEHAMHHSTSGDLDRRGAGDIWTMTVEEYLASTKGRRLAYRIARNPMVMFLLAPILMLLVYQRFPAKGAKPKERRSVWLMNLAILAFVAAMMWIFGPWHYLIMQAGITLVGGGAGVWLFYVQHQFEDVVWERREGWDYAAAAMQGSSYYKLPKILQWFSGNIGFHHIHHLSPKIPNYHLQECHESAEMFSSVPPVTLRKSLKTIGLKLWDEKRRRLVSFRSVREASKRRDQ